MSAAGAGAAAVANSWREMPFHALELIFDFATATSAEATSQWCLVSSRWNDALKNHSSDLWTRLYRAQGERVVPPVVGSFRAFAISRRWRSTVPVENAVQDIEGCSAEFAFRCPVLAQNLSLVGVWRPSTERVQQAAANGVASVLDRRPAGGGDAVAASLDAAAAANDEQEAPNAETHPVLFCDVCDRHVLTVTSGSQVNAAAANGLCVQLPPEVPSLFNSAVSNDIVNVGIVVAPGELAAFQETLLHMASGRTMKARSGSRQGPGDRGAFHLFALSVAANHIIFDSAAGVPRIWSLRCVAVDPERIAASIAAATGDGDDAAHAAATASVLGALCNDADGPLHDDALRLAGQAVGGLSYVIVTQAADAGGRLENFPQGTSMHALESAHRVHHWSAATEQELANYREECTRAGVAQEAATPVVSATDAASPAGGGAAAAAPAPLPPLQLGTPESAELLFDLLWMKLATFVRNLPRPGNRHRKGKVAPRPGFVLKTRRSLVQ